MNIYKTELFPYLEGDMLAGKTQTLTIIDFGFENVASERGEERKCVLSFNETNKVMILNKTNAKVLTSLFGQETDEWKGKRITVYTERVKAFGKYYDALRMKQSVQDVVTRAQQDQLEMAQELAQELPGTEDKEFDEQVNLFELGFDLKGEN